MHQRLLAALCAGAMSIAIVVVPASTGTAAAPSAAVAADTDGLFGTADPTYDGVYRQSYALMGLKAAGTDVPASAIAWLVRQQCPDGAFVAYRPDPAQPCPETDPVAYSGPDTNSTALAALALMQYGQKSAARRAIAWLASIQLAGGGWGYVKGSPPDSVSTALVLEALEEAPGNAKARARAIAWVSRQIAPCDAPEDERYGIHYQPGLMPDAISSSQGLLGLANAFPVRARSQHRGAPKVSCGDNGRPANAKFSAARWIASKVSASDGSLPDPFAPGSADWNSTALGVVGLVASGTSGRATDLAIAALKKHAEDYVSNGTADKPAALGTLMLAAVATGNNPSDFGGIDLPVRLLSTLQS